MTITLMGWLGLIFLAAGVGAAVWAICDDVQDWLRGNPRYPPSMD